MEYNVGITIGAFSFSILLLILYLKKNTKRNLRSKIYLIFLSFIMAFCVTEFLSVYMFSLNMSDIVKKIFWLIHWSMCNLVFYVLLLYSVYIGNKKEINTIKDLVKYNWLTIVASISIVIQTILMFSVYKVDLNNIDFLYEPSTLYCGFIILLVVILVSINAKNITKYEKIEIVITAVAFVLFVLLQSIYTDYSIISAGFVIVCFNFYFNAENPDILLVDEMLITKDNTEKNNNIKNEFLSYLTNEVDVPSKAILDAATSLDNVSYDELNKLTDEIIVNANNLINTLDNVINITESDYENINYDIRYSTKELFNKIIKKVKHLLKGRKVTPIFNITQSISSMLIGNPDAIYEAIINIVIDAVENTSVGRITLTINSNKVGDLEEITFKISDTGIGIKDDEQKNIFDLDSAKKSVNNLRIVSAKKHIDSMNGKMWFDSHYHVGTNFYIQFTQKISDATQMGPIEEIDNELDYSNKKVLIVDSNDLDYEVIESYLKRYNIVCERTKTGDECIFNIKKDNQYDMIFIENKLSDITGLELFDVLKSLDGYKVPPIVMCTAISMLKTKKQIIDHGFDDFLEKPLERDELERIIIKYLK